MHFLLGKRKSCQGQAIWFLAKRPKLCDLQTSTKRKRKYEFNHHANKLSKISETEEQKEAMSAQESDLRFYSLFPTAATASQTTTMKVESQMSKQGKGELFFDNVFWKDAVPSFDEAFVENKTKLQENADVSTFNAFQFWKPVEPEQMDFDIN